MNVQYDFVCFGSNKNPLLIIKQECSHMDVLFRPRISYQIIKNKLLFGFLKRNMISKIYGTFLVASFDIVIFVPECLKREKNVIIRFPINLKIFQLG